MNNQKTMGNKGFSLVELIVVIAIMAVLVGVLAPQFLKYVEKSRQSGDITSVQSIMTSVETAVSDGGVTGNVTITISAGANSKATVSGTGFTPADFGITPSTSLKSSGWKAITLTYNVTDFKWSISGTTVNDKSPKLDMKDVINGTTSVSGS